MFLKVGDEPELQRMDARNVAPVLQRKAAGPILAPQVPELVVIDRGRRQIGLFTTLLLTVSTVIVGLIIYTMTIDKKKTYIVTVKTTCGTIVWKLDAKLAPTTVNNIVFLVKNHFYDNTIFHRVQVDPTFAIVQGGDPTGTGSGNPGYEYQGESPPTTEKYPRGTLAMASSA